MSILLYLKTFYIFARINLNVNHQKFYNMTSFPSPPSPDVWLFIVHLKFSILLSFPSEFLSKSSTKGGSKATLFRFERNYKVMNFGKFCSLLIALECISSIQGKIYWIAIFTDLVAWKPQSGSFCWGQGFDDFAFLTSVLAAQKKTL